jgi:hypothetical protein
MPPASTWNDREIPILEAVWAAEEAGDRPGPEEIAAATGLQVDVVGRSVAALVKADYLSGADASSLADTFDQFIALQLLERGRREIGQWPPGPADAFVVALDRLIDAEQDPVKRSLLVKLRDAAVDVAKQVLAGAVVAAAQTQM